MLLSMVRSFAPGHQPAQLDMFAILRMFSMNSYWMLHDLSGLKECGSIARV